MTFNLTDMGLAGAALRRGGMRIFLAIAIVGAGCPAQTASAASEEYRVGPGDTLLVTTYGDAGLTGQFVVDPVGDIGFPLVGDFHAMGLTTSEIGKQLGNQIASYVAGRSITVAVAAYAPVFIVGDVEKPGQYPYHPGMTPLEFVAVSGGSRRGKDVIDGAQIQLVATRQQYSDLTLQIFSNQVRRARLTAEMNGGEFSYALDSNLDPSERENRQRIVDGEATLFRIRRSNLMAQKSALESQRQSYREEMDALVQRETLHDDELKLLEQDVIATKTLVDRKLTAQSTLRDVERQLSAARRDALEQASFLARAKQGELDMAQRANALDENLRGEAAIGISTLDLDTIRKQKQMAALLDQMAAISSSADALRARETRARLTYVIMRPSNDTFVEIPVNEFAPLKPRDIVRATLVAPELPSGTPPLAETDQQSGRETGTTIQ